MDECIESKIEGIDLIKDFIKIKNFTRELKNRTNLSVDIDYTLNKENLNKALEEIINNKKLGKNYSPKNTDINLNIISNYDISMPVYNIEKTLIDIINITLDKISIYDKDEENNKKCIFEKIIIKDVNF